MRLYINIMPPEATPRLYVSNALPIATGAS